jgi:hypothetical protein
MSIALESAQYINGEKLTSWSVLPGGEHVCLGFAAIGGETHRIVLPFDALTSLLMTVPRMLRSALNERFSDDTLRVVHPLGEWRLEESEGDNGVILNLGTRDGFEVSFAVPDQDAGSLGDALLTTTGQPTSTLTRRPN